VTIVRNTNPVKTIRGMIRLLVGKALGRVRPAAGG
jgi:hypothetical protein